MKNISSPMVCYLIAAIVSSASFISLASGLSVSFIPPTDEDNAVVARDWSYVNVSVSGGTYMSSFLDWNRSLLGYWSFGESSGSTVLDSSTYGLDGELGGDTQRVAGRSGQGLSFSGDGDYVDYGSPSELEPAAGLTFEAWIKPATSQEVCWDEEESTGNYGVAAKADPTISDDAWSWQLRYGSPESCRLGFQFNTVSDGSVWVTVQQDLTSDQWYHIAGTFNGTGVSCYLNGVLQESADASALYASGAHLILGEDGWQDYFTGSIDEVRMWNRALSENEIKASYNAGANPLMRRFEGLPEGQYQYYAYATDSSGAWAKTETRALTVNLEATTTTTTTTSTTTSLESTTTTTTSLESTTTTTSLESTTTTSTASTTSTIAAHIPGDANYDGHVDYDDLLLLAASYGKNVGQTGYDLRTDFNSDGAVGYSDLVILAANYGR